MACAGRRPPAERTDANREVAIAYAVYRTAIDQVSAFADLARVKMATLGLDPDDTRLDPASPIGVGNLVATALLQYRKRDGANQDGTVVPGFLTPHWYRVTPFALKSSDQYRPGPPPLVGSEQLAKEIEECIECNANLTPREKAIVEFMRISAACAKALEHPTVPRHRRLGRQAGLREKRRADVTPAIRLFRAARGYTSRRVGSSERPAGNPTGNHAAARSHPHRRSALRGAGRAQQWNVARTMSMSNSRRASAPHPK